MTKDKAELRRIWDRLEKPMVEDLCGEWQIQILTGFTGLKYIMRRWLNHRKHIFYSHAWTTHIGCNIFKDRYKWGWFEVDDKEACVLLDYGAGYNNVFTIDIQDKIRQVDLNVMLGKFYRKGRFKAWFIMYRILTVGTLVTGEDVEFVGDPVPVGDNTYQQVRYEPAPVLTVEAIEEHLDMVYKAGRTIDHTPWSSKLGPIEAVIDSIHREYMAQYNKALFGDDPKPKKWWQVWKR